jgi:hypothetical protein
MSHKAMKEYWQCRQETRDLAALAECGYRTVAEKLAFIASEDDALSDNEIIGIFKEENAISLSL